MSSSGFGQDGPQARYRAYAYNLQAACTLGYLTRNAAGESAEIDIAWADLIAAYSLATIIAAWAVGPAGNAGVGLDFAMADLVIAHFNEFIAAASIASDDLDADLRVDTAERLAPYGPNGVYPDRRRLDRVVGRRRRAVGAVRAGARRRMTDDVQIANATRTRAAAELAAELRASGVPAEKVAEPADLLESVQLARAASSRRSSTASGGAYGSSAFRGGGSGVRRFGRCGRPPRRRGLRPLDDTEGAAERLVSWESGRCWQPHSPSASRWRRAMR